MAKSSHLDMLRNVPLFSALSAKDLGRIAKASDVVDVVAGKLLVDQGRTGHQFFLIVNGTATVRTNGRKASTLGPGDHFGELSLLAREPRNASVTADTGMTVLVLGQREFGGLLQEIPGLSVKLLASMATRLRQADLKNHKL